MIAIEATCTVCGADFTPAPDAFRRGDWRTCTRCRGDPDDQVPGVTLDDSTPAQGQITSRNCQAERKPQ